jgi:hypothetical protein
MSSQKHPPPPASTAAGGLHRTIGKHLPDLILGAMDGVITTLAVVAGVAGASLSPAVLLILGFANLLADGFSMGASNVLSRRSDPQSGELPTLAAAASHGVATSWASRGQASFRFWPTSCPGSSRNSRRRRSLGSRPFSPSEQAARLLPSAAGPSQGWRCCCWAPSRPQWPTVWEFSVGWSLRTQACEPAVPCRSTVAQRSPGSNAILRASSDSALQVVPSPGCGLAGSGRMDLSRCDRARARRLAVGHGPGPL